MAWKEDVDSITVDLGAGDQQITEKPVRLHGVFVDEEVSGKSVIQDGTATNVPAAGSMTIPDGSLPGRQLSGGNVQFYNYLQIVSGGTGKITVLFYQKLQQ
tara:strand:- start:15607 stop:15909 length:303 start_codon:yes stop_codon:yes gene_type:complete